MNQLRQGFKVAFGEETWSSLRHTIMSSSPIITIGGDQLTGKSTLTENLARRFSGISYGVGETLREEANRRDISIAEMCNIAKDDLSIDLQVDMEMFRKICEGNQDGSPLIAQGRLPSVLATASREFLDKPEDSIHRIYLKCSIVEQTLRFMSREVGKDEYEIAKRAFGDDIHFETLEEASNAVRDLPLPTDTKDHVLNEFETNQRRDDDDRERFVQLYGEEFDYRDKSFYDIEIDTSNIPSEETFRIAVESIRNSNVLRPYFYRVGC